MTVSNSRNIKGTIDIPGDKSISHRAIMLGSLANGTTKVSNFLMGDDCLSTVECFKQMGIDISIKQDTLFIKGKGLHGLKKPKEKLNVGNSGTTIRLLSGILAGQNFESTITGDDSIQSRPMDRIITPLTLMNANIKADREATTLAPLNIKPSKLKAITYKSPVASAQVKSAILLAGLYADGQTKVIEPSLSRNHTELMLEAFNGSGIDVTVPGDISSAAFFIVAALILPDSKVYMQNIGINPTRAGVIKVLQDMNADITLSNKRTQAGEPVCDILVKSSNLTATTISGDIIPTLIDEIPIITVAACFASGPTIIMDAEELRVKECDRISAMTEELNSMGAHITEAKDGMIIQGNSTLEGTTVNSYNDHRVAMSLAVAGLKATGKTTIKASECVNISFPKFFKLLKDLCNK